MDLTAIVADAQYVLQLGTYAVQLGQDVVPYVTTAYNLLVNKTTLTDAQRATLQTQEDSMRAMLDAPSIPADAPDAPASADLGPTSTDPLTVGAAIASNAPISGS
jgi:hypothetical protein